MRGFHVTFYENLDSILSSGLFPQDTTKNNFPFALDNRERKRLFFMTDFSSSKYWFRTHHPYNWEFDVDSELSVEIEERESVIIEFEIPQELNIQNDPYAWGMTNPMSNSRFVEGVIHPSNIVDIHEV
jgi:hypothetical protein